MFLYLPVNIIPFMPILLVIKPFNKAENLHLKYSGASLNRGAPG